MESTMPRVMEITTPLGDDVLLFHTMHAREELSRVGECRLELLSLKNDINLDRDPRQERHREGGAAGRRDALLQRLRDALLAGRHATGSYRRYYAVVHPWLWFLSRTADCRIFQEMTRSRDRQEDLRRPPDARRSRTRLTGSYAKWTYCVQYRETDLNFVSRLMETGRHLLLLHARRRASTRW